ncbi:MAG: PQQ-binding-like beta-propeller repeat protein [Candidatus Glassbacteria bacterium]|nr:PQQ-binding-like beta-propeller repeat protein [Candidatus Glassbacteria bacterium]
MFPGRQVFYRHKVNRFFPACVLVATWLLPIAGLSLAAEKESASVAEHLKKLTGIDRGLCSVIGAENGDIALKLAADGKLLVDLLDPDYDKVLQMRGRADEQGTFGRSFTADKTSTARLPYSANTVDLVLAIQLSGKQLDALSAAELVRVLAPRGKAVVGRLNDRAAGSEAFSRKQLERWRDKVENAELRIEEDEVGLWLVLTKPPLEGADDWTHWEHGPDNNPVSRDTAIRAPYMTQFLGLPYYIAMPAITTIAGGKIFTAMGHIAHHVREEPWLNTLIAQNGYNGLELWRRKIPDGYLVHRSAFIATENTFYMVNHDGTGCLMLDPETGREKGRINLPELQGEWKWMALVDGVLYVLAGEQKDPPETTVVRSSARAWSWDDLSTGYYEQRIPWGFGNTIAAYDLATGKVKWVYDEETPIDSRALAMGEGRLYFYCPDSHLGSLDAATGKLVWSNSDARLRQLIEEPGRGLVSTPGWRTTCFCIYTPKGLFFEAQTRMNLVAVSLEDGKMMWHRQKTSNNPNMLYLDGNLIVGIGPQGYVQVIDPLTGATLEDLGFRKRSCARVTACWDSFFCRGWPEGLTRYDRLTKKVLFNGAVRPGCNDGVIPANGLLYMGPWACDCNLSLMGRVVMCPAGDFDFKPAIEPAGRLEPFRKNLKRVAAFETTDLDWPTYRGDNDRSASTRAIVPGKVHKVWEYAPAAEFRPSSPIAAGGMVFLSGDDSRVRALDAATGKERWCFLAGGPVLQPPTVWNGRAYIGAGDGYVYALEAATGETLWRFQAAPVSRKIMIYGSLCSTWPVNSGVLVQDGKAYAAAGIIDYDGTYVYALDALTGKLIWQNTGTGHLDEALRKGISAQGTLTLAGGRLWMPGGNVVSPASFDLATGKYMGAGVVDGSPRANRGEEIGVVAGKYVMYGGRLRFSAAENVVNPANFSVIDISDPKPEDRGLFLRNGRITPAWDDTRMVLTDVRYTAPVCYSLDAIDEYVQAGDRNARPASLWQSTKQMEGRLRESDTVSLVLAANALVEVYSTEVVRHRNPRWRVRASSLTDGSLIWEEDLGSPAMPGGLLVDRDGRVVVVLEDGRMVCFAAGEEI